MVLSEKRKFIRWLIIVASIAIVGIFLWNLHSFFTQLKKEERKKMEIWVKAQTELIHSDNSDSDLAPIILSVIENNTTTPMILFSVKDSVYGTKNIKGDKAKTQEDRAALANQFAMEYAPLKMYYHDELYSIVYYGNSDLINRLKYFPIMVIVVIVVFGFILYYFYTTSKAIEQNKLWAGMAKETAHQIGTPLSSLVGWSEILKTEEVNTSYINEMNKDIGRLQTITERFSKIGSVPDLEKHDFVEATAVAFTYLKIRSSRLIQISIQAPDHEINVRLNEQLLGWTIENLVKNAIDAVKGEGEIHLNVKEDQKWAYLFISDTGKGIPKKDFKRVFKPGETSKNRGWGLGLSLAKRIVEEYHDGRIRILRSELGKGTTFEIKLLKV